MTTNESFFFRDKIPFDHFRDAIMPGLMAARARERRIRIWCAAASTGQEPYSLAMCLKEMKQKLGGWRVEILGTDLSTEVLEKAKAGVYSQFEVQRGLPIQMLVKYFSQVGDTWQIAPEIRAMVQYRPLNLLADFAHLGRFDVVFCRNVLIYFDQETKIGVLNRIAQDARAGRLSGARRRRDRGGPDRRVQAGAGQARPLCAEQGRRAAGRTLRRSLPYARSRSSERAEPSFHAFQRGLAAVERREPVEPARVQQQRHQFGAREDRGDLLQLAQSSSLASATTRATSISPGLRAACSRQHGAMRGEQGRVGEQPFERAAPIAARRIPRPARWRVRGCPAARLSSGVSSSFIRRSLRPAAGFAVHCASGTARIRPTITGVIQANSENDTP